MTVQSCVVAVVGWVGLVVFSFWTPAEPVAPADACLEKARVAVLERGGPRRELPLLLCPEEALAKVGCPGPPPAEGRALIVGHGCFSYPMGGGARLLLGLPIDLNEAEVGDLVSLPGIGAGTARKIWENRKSLGPFLSVEDLSRVRGVGETRIRGLRGLVTVDRVVR